MAEKLVNYVTHIGSDINLAVPLATGSNFTTGPNSLETQIESRDLANKFSNKSETRIESTVQKV